uniref:Uncharacterized protein n=1 Tax=Anopheles merus TaxID=30066 RepID=A0A182V4T5_ANOME
MHRGEWNKPIASGCRTHTPQSARVPDKSVHITGFLIIIFISCVELWRFPARLTDSTRRSIRGAGRYSRASRHSERARGQLSMPVRNVGSQITAAAVCGWNWALTRIEPIVSLRKLEYEL